MGKRRLKTGIQLNLLIMDRIKSLIAGTALLVSLAGCEQRVVPGWKSFSGDKNIERRVDSVLRLMTLEEKVGQMAQYSCNWDITGPVMTDDFEPYLKRVGRQYIQCLYRRWRAQITRNGTGGKPAENTCALRLRCGPWFPDDFPDAIG